MNRRAERDRRRASVYSTGAGALALDVLARGDLRTILVSGELDGATSYALRTLAEDVWLCAPGRVVVSFEACTYCDGRGFAALAWLRRRAGARLSIVLPRRRSARRAFRILGIAGGACTDPPVAQAFFASALRG